MKLLLALVAAVLRRWRVDCIARACWCFYNLYAVVGKARHVDSVIVNDRIYNIVRRRLRPILALRCVIKSISRELDAP